MDGGLFKAEGAGNDFVLGTGDWAAKLADDSALVARLCDRRRGIGADGCLALFPEGRTALRLVYRNSDGGLASFCANGTRCAARAAVEILGMPSSCVVETGWTGIPARVGGDGVELDLPAPLGAPRKLDLESAGRRFSARLLEVGVPHLVVPVRGLDDFDIAAFAPGLRRHEALGERGANVHFVERGAHAVAIRSWERGVEGETLCCGSGVVASALLDLADSGEACVKIRPRSGDRLTLTAEGAPRCPSTLRGPATIVAEIRPCASWL